MTSLSPIPAPNSAPTPMPTPPSHSEPHAIGFRADGCKVFAALAQARPDNLEVLGLDITDWLRANPAVRIVKVETHLHDGAGFVWLTVLVFYSGAATEGPSPRNRPTPGAHVHVVPPAWQQQREAADGIGRPSGDNGGDNGVDDDDEPWELPPAP